MNESKSTVQKNSEEMPITDVTAITDDLADFAEQTITEEVEQVSKSVVIGKKEVSYEDGRNVISVIINAISVRINMLRGTVKTLMACLMVLLLAVGMLAFNGLDSGSDTDASADTGTETAESETPHEYPAEEGHAVNTERAASAEDYVIISPNYRYTLPEGILDVWEPDDFYDENETFCDFEHNDNVYTIRSYMLDYVDKDLSAVVKTDLSQFESMEHLEEEHIESNNRDILRLRFETKDDQGAFTAVTGYYWFDNSPKICCLEISSDGWHDEGVEEEILNSVYQASSGSTESATSAGETPPDAEAIWQEQQKEEAMNSLVEDAMRNQNEGDWDWDPLFD